MTRLHSSDHFRVRQDSPRPEPMVYAIVAICVVACVAASVSFWQQGKSPAVPASGNSSIILLSVDRSASQ